MHQVELPGGRFCYLAAEPPPGPARPLAICLHGFPDHAPTMAPLLSDLAAAGHRAVAPWLRGYAPSTLSGPFDIERLSADAIELADALSPERPVVLIGHDWGAAATHAACALAPHRIAAAVTMAVPHPLAFARNIATQPAQLARSWYVLFFQLPVLPERAIARDDFAFIDWLWRRWSAGPLLDGEARRALHDCLARSMPAPLGPYRAITRPTGGLATLARPDRPGTGPIDVPMLHLQGALDGCVAPSACAGQERYFRGPFRSEVIDGAGHWVHLEARRAVSERILSFLADH
jgi:pimeloyl-ACP methyl ester carboxylesterase